MNDVDTKSSDPTAERVQVIRDLRQEIAGLTAEDETEVLFQTRTPGRRSVTIYRTDTGQPVTMFAHHIEAALQKRRVDGKYAFTARKEEAPHFRRGNVKCFLHPDSPERPILDQIGIATICMSAHFANAYAQRIQALHKHGKEWAAYQDYVQSLEKAEERQERRQQVEATLTLAGKVAGAPVNSARRGGRPRKEA